MVDLKLSFAKFQADLVSRGYDLETDDSLQTAVIVSLFTDREADDSDELPAGETDRRGWWADSARPRSGDAADPHAGKIGSKLWLIRREKKTEAVRVLAVQYCLEALQWLVDDGLVDSVDVTAEWQGSMLAIQVRVDDSDFAFNTPWEG